MAWLAVRDGWAGWLCLLPLAALGAIERVRTCWGIGGRHDSGRNRRGMLFRNQQSRIRCLRLSKERFPVLSLDELCGPGFLPVRAQGLADVAESLQERPNGVRS